MQRKIISIIVTGGEKSLHSGQRQNKTIIAPAAVTALGDSWSDLIYAAPNVTDDKFAPSCSTVRRHPLSLEGKEEKKQKEIKVVTSPLDSDAGDELVSAESQSVTGDHSDVHLWTEEHLFDLLAVGVLASQSLRRLTGLENTYSFIAFSPSRCRRGYIYQNT